MKTRYTLTPLIFAGLAALLPAAETPAVAVPAPASTGNTIAPGPFAPNWESLGENYEVPEWFRDAKFGIWAHWSAQCVPEQGDWYARNMYIQGTRQYDYHVAHYGHPSKFGFMELDHLWTAANWDPEKLMQLYQHAGAKYFVALANHHDNFDAYDSKYQPWNSVNVGAKKDIVGTWAKIARAHGLRFGVSNHSSHAWHWFQPAYGHDVEGAEAGVPYDAARLTKADGKGTWWEGLDPQDLYAGLRMAMPDSLKTAKEAETWHKQNDGHWYESIPPNDNGYAKKWFLRTQDLVDKYHPDLLYFDDTELPLEQHGLDIAAHYYNANRAFHGGKLEAVLNAKGIKPEHKSSLVADIERGVADGIQPQPWQTDTCIGSWHYDRRIFDEHKYKTVGQVVRMLADIVSKNGNLLLSVPVRGDGTIDADEVAFLQCIAGWMDNNSEAIFGTRPWKVYGEGPSVEEAAEKGQFGGARDVRSKPYTAEDIRFTTKEGALYAIFFAWPENGSVVVRSLATTPAARGTDKVGEVTLLGSHEQLLMMQNEAGLHVALPAKAPGEHAFVLKIKGVVAAGR
jgi:alpha-L-fucosidase